MLMIGSVLPVHLTAQVKWRMPITLKDSAADNSFATATGYFGLHPSATNCIDAATLTGFNDRWFERFAFDVPYTPDMF